MKDVRSVLVSGIGCPGFTDVKEHADDKDLVYAQFGVRCQLSIAPLSLVQSVHNSYSLNYPVGDLSIQSQATGDGGH